MKYLRLIIAVFPLILLLGCNTTGNPKNSLATNESVTNESKIGIVWMHGKWGHPNAPHFEALTRVLKSEGFIVETPVMPWGRDRMYNADYSTALVEIDRSVEVLRKKGAKRIIIAGQSFGANASIAYVASGRKVDAIMPIAPGHSPNLGIHRYADDVVKARRMIAAGNPDEKMSFLDINQGQQRKVTTSAKIYMSYFDPEGMGSMPNSAFSIKEALPFLYVIGTEDRLHNRGKDYIYNLVPSHPKNKYLVVNANHKDTPKAAARQIVEWIRSLEP